jgi:hypothetical protein
MRLSRLLVVLHAVSLGAIGAGAAIAQPADKPEETIPLGDEPLDLSTPLPDDRIPKLSKRAPNNPVDRPLDTKLGVNYRQSPIPNAEFQPDPFIRNGLTSVTSPDSTGVAWAHVTAPQLPFGWDSASIDTQVDPLDDHGKISGTLSRSLALSDEIAVTLRNGYSTERALQGSSPHTWASNQSLRFNLLPTDTTVSIDASLASGADRWLRSLSAEQKLFGGPISLSGSVSETSSGELSKSLRAGFKQNW